MTQEYVRVEVEAGIATITIDRPAALNALNSQVVGQLGRVIKDLPFPEVRCAILTGSGKAFVAGADIAEMREMTGAQALEFAKAGHEVLNSLESAPFPIIAAVNGFALGGGCELALACDFIYASEKAKFGQPEVKLGVIPGFGGTQRLLRRVGIAKARELIFIGDIIRSEEALRIGLVDAVFPPEGLIESATSAALKVAAAGPLAIRAAKQTLYAGEDLPLREANRGEIDAFAALFETEDQAEGMSAFVEKRTPVFRAK